ncbi:HAD family hydrolase [Companilactobacillus nantensis]|nr:HAD family phosphatase [Companilactobacillus nantensis]GEO63704.1 haloacid dehalogenase [Companilactobacillus nantensis]
MIKAMIFDFNGTMIFDGGIQKDSWRAFLKQQFNRNMTEVEFAQHIAGRNNRHTFEYYLQRRLSDSELADISEQKEQMYRAECLRRVNEFQLVAGLPEFLDKCLKKQIQVNIATASEASNVDFFFEQLQLDRWFDRQKVALNDGNLAGKPAPDIFLHAMKNVGVNSEHSAIFEDSVSGIQAANNAQAGKVILVEDAKLASIKIPGDLRIDQMINDYQNLAVEM